MNVRSTLLNITFFCLIVCGQIAFSMNDDAILDLVDSLISEVSSQRVSSSDESLQNIHIEGKYGIYEKNLEIIKANVEAQKSDRINEQKKLKKQINSNKNGKKTGGKGRSCRTGKFNSGR